MQLAGIDLSDDASRSIVITISPMVTPGRIILPPPIKRFPDVHRFGEEISKNCCFRPNVPEVRCDGRLYRYVHPDLFPNNHADSDGITIQNTQFIFISTFRPICIFLP